MKRITGKDLRILAKDAIPLGPFSYQPDAFPVFPIPLTWARRGLALDHFSGYQGHIEGSIPTIPIGHAGLIIFIHGRGIINEEIIVTDTKYCIVREYIDGVLISEITAGMLQDVGLITPTPSQPWSYYTQGFGYSIHIPKRKFCHSYKCEVYNEQREDQHVIGAYVLYDWYQDAHKNDKPRIDTDLAVP